jgi:hypothetical protein
MCTAGRSGRDTKSPVRHWLQVLIDRSVLPPA